MAVKVIVREHLDLTKGFKIDDAAKKIQVAVKNGHLEYAATGEIKLVDSIVNNAGKGIENAVLQQGGGTSKLVFTLADGSTKEVDVSVLATDVNVTGGTLNAETLQLTLKQDEGGPDVVVDLAKLTETTTADSTSVALAGNGTKANALTATVKVSAEANNKLSIKNDGLFAVGSTAEELQGDGLVIKGGKLALDKAGVFTVELQDAFGEPLGMIMPKASA